MSGWAWAAVIIYVVTGWCVALLVRRASLKQSARRGTPELVDHVAAAFMGGMVGMLWPCALPLLGVLLFVLAIGEKGAKR